MKNSFKLKGYAKEIFCVHIEDEAIYMLHNIELLLGVIYRACHNFLPDLEDL